MRTHSLWTIPPERAGSGIRLLVSFLLLTIPTLCLAGSITAYRDPSGRVIFVNEPDGTDGAKDRPISAAETQASQIDLAPKAGSQAKQPSAAASLPALDSAVTAAGQSLKIASTGSEPQAQPSGEPRWNDMAEMIEWTASRHEVDPDLVRAIVRVESNFNPRAVSPKGAGGLMQLIPATARRFGVENIFDPKANLDGGVRYLKHLMELYGGDLKLSLAAYNAGENAVDRHNGVPPYAETRNYLKKIALTYPLESNGLPRKKEPIIEKFLDVNGVVHFTNAD